MKRHNLTYELIDSPIGALLAVASPRGLVALEFDGRKRLPAFRSRLAAHAPDTDLTKSTTSGNPLEPTLRWFQDYFAGRFPSGRELELDLTGTEFERLIWDALLDLPAGTTRSYGELARQVGSPGAARAAGVAVGRNPVAIVVPCHRIIGADGSLTGFGGGLPRKQWLLEHEGVAVGASARATAGTQQLALLG
jgi:O-6-methylguanine DNA methyltransferase